MKPASFTHHSNADLIDEYYHLWLKNPEAVDPTWRAFFQGFTLGTQGQPLSGPARESLSILDSLKQSQVHALISAYRSLGHTQAHLDPLSGPPPPQPKLQIEDFQLSPADLEESFDVGHYLGGGQMKLNDIIESLQTTYCGQIGVEYMHIQDTDVRRWLQEKMEPARNQPAFTRDKKLRILRKLYQAEIFERFLHTRYVGQKRFSLEGAETLIPCLDAVVEKCASLGVAEIVMGMAHRGRLNVLANVLGKSYEFLFEEFSENFIPHTVGGDGDVKYHLGYECELRTASGSTVEMRLTANPSHLEAVDPVVEGKARARQRIRGDTARKTVLPLLIHGDAAFAGQGMVAEVLNFSQLPGYRTGGTLHIVVNNQIGFTTNPSEARSSRYCTDIAKMIEAPIFHVNGDDPLAVVMVAELAIEFREAFQRDIVIDMYCFRRHGHNESDEPVFTQPTMYQKIAQHPLISQTLSQSLIAEQTLTDAEAERVKSEFQERLETALARVNKSEEENLGKAAKFRDSNAVFQPPFDFTPVPTGASPELLAKAVAGLTRVPPHLKLNSKIKRLLETRRRVFQEDLPLDWSFAEALAFGTLLLEGTPVRLSGQDSERGTFSQRHAALYDGETRERYVPLLNLDPNQAQFCVYNSLLSEAAVLGFDYGYSIDYPQMLCLWEAQFGDFANGAQVIIDQFITSSESKWQRVSGIVLLLPHGYEGQGPEHSSARLERFLQACAEENIQVCNLTTPAQYFHVLRRQMKRSFRKPLVIMSPKSLLRQKEATSQVDELTGGSFQEILDDSSAPARPNRLILCSGKVYYDLIEYRSREGISDTALVRVEQLYPLHTERLCELAGRYQGISSLVWCQEESQNMGAWTFMAPALESIFGRRPAYAGREPSASPAVGSLALHRMELQQFLQAAFSA